MYGIAGLAVEAVGCGEKFLARAQSYVCDARTADIVVTVDEAELRRAMAEVKTLSEDDCRYLLSGMRFYFELLAHDGLMLHASAVAKGGRAYAFSANSGVGKSTHAELWRRAFDDVYMINDDKPALRLEQGRFLAYGTPWSGKHDISCNVGLPLGGVAFIERAEQNSIERITPAKAVGLVMGQTIRNIRAERMELLLGLVERLVESTPVYRLRCSADIGAAELACSVMCAEGDI